MSGPWSHDSHVTARVAIPCAALVLILTSATFAAIVWDIALMMMVVVPSLSLLGITVVVANLLRGGTYRPGSRPFLGGGRVRSLPDKRRRVVERPLEGRVLPPVTRPAVRARSAGQLPRPR